MSNQNLQRSRVYHSLIRRLGWLGGERVLVLLALGLSIYLGFIYTLAVGFTAALLISGSVWTCSIFILTRMGKHDMQLAAVVWRHRKYKPYYPAKGRLDAEPVEMAAFIGK